MALPLWTASSKAHGYTSSSCLTEGVTVYKTIRLQMKPCSCKRGLDKAYASMPRISHYFFYATFFLRDWLLVSRENDLKIAGAQEGNGNFGATVDLSLPIALGKD